MNAVYVTSSNSHVKAFDYVKKTVYDTMKRLRNVVCSGVGLIALSPIFPGNALLIYIGDTGPVLFKQTRIGKDGKPFKIYKFQSI